MKLFKTSLGEGLAFCISQFKSHDSTKAASKERMKLFKTSLGEGLASGISI